MLEKWWSECAGYEDIPLYKDSHSEYYIYKGFKLTRSEGILEILDVRRSDFYDPVTKGNLRTLKAYGFIKGCDIIIYRRDLKRIKSYTRILARMYTERDGLEKQLRTGNRITLEKNLRGLTQRIRGAIDLLFFYDSRSKQIKSKYNLK